MQSIISASCSYVMDNDLSMANICVRVIVLGGKFQWIQKPPHVMSHCVNLQQIMVRNKKSLFMQYKHPFLPHSWENKKTHCPTQIPSFENQNSCYLKAKKPVMIFHKAVAATGQRVPG